MSSPPGWYPDPLGGQGARYWDGAQWDGAIQPEVKEFPAEDPAPPPGNSRQRWPLWAGMAAAAVVAAGSMAFALTRPAEDASKAAPTPTPTSTTSAPMVTPAEAAEAAVKISMQRKLDSDPDLKEFDLTVVDVMLVNKAGNEYKGIATVRTPDGVEHDVPIDVTSDEDTTLWDAPPGAFRFVLEDRPLPPPPAAPRPLPPAPAPNLPPGALENFKLCPSGLAGVASADTSCAFADSVRAAWYAQPGRTISAYSPVTHQSYVMTCAPEETNAWPGSKRCVGTNDHGTLLIVYIS